MLGKKNRAVIILHPDFDQPGSAGVKEAKEFAENFIDSQKNLITEAEKNQPLHVIAELRKYTKSMRVIVRNLPEDVL